MFLNHFSYFIENVYTGTNVRKYREHRHIQKERGGEEGRKGEGEGEREREFLQSQKNSIMSQTFFF